MFLLDVFLPVILYVVAIILLIVLIVLGIRVIALLDKVDRIVDNVEGKVNAFNGAFSVLERATNGFASITDSLIFNASTFVSKLFNNKKKGKEDLEDE
ncbi:MAG: hypothetical protein IJI22_03855 [Bacilli bacterium]|nr:hypothetical protein [Bacilli bacterium]